MRFVWTGFFSWLLFRFQIGLWRVNVFPIRFAAENLKINTLRILFFVVVVATAFDRVFFLAELFVHVYFCSLIFQLNWENTSRNNELLKRKRYATVWPLQNIYLMDFPFRNFRIIFFAINEYESVWLRFFFFVRFFHVQLWFIVDGTAFFFSTGSRELGQKCIILQFNYILWIRFYFLWTFSLAVSFKLSLSVVWIYHTISCRMLWHPHDLYI